MTNATTLPIRLRRLLGVLAAAAAVTLTPAGAMAAAGPADPGAASITHVETNEHGLQVLVSVPADAQVDLDNVAVTVGGAKADATAALAGSDTTVRRTAILAIDTSKSMKGKRFDAARAAATEFIDSVPKDVYVGVVTFAGSVDTALPPTQDRAAALAVLDHLQLSKQTRLYDGVIQAVQVAGSDGQRTMLVLSDGADTSSTAIDDATKAIHDGGVLTDVVALDQSGASLQALQSLADAGQGQVISANPAALQQAFAAEADVLAHQVLLTVRVPGAVTKTQATIKVSLPTASGALTAEAFSTIRAVPSSVLPPLAQPSSPGWSAPSWLLYVGPAVLGLGLLLVIVLLLQRRPERMTAEERVAKYTETAATTDVTQGPRLDTDVAFATTKETAANFLARNKDLDHRISVRLEGAGSDLKSSEWLLLHGGIFFVSGLLGIFISGGNLVVGVLFLIAGLFVPWMYLGFRRSRRRKRFNSSLPDTLQLVSGSLAAGLSLAQAVDTIVREGQEPIASEFRRVLVETRLGVSLEEALEGVADRFQSKDFEWVVMAINIQRQVGGNLAELLDTVAATMREREYLRRQVAALAAEGKLSAYVLGGLPPLFMVYLLLTNYDYVSIMFHRPLGWAMLAGGAMILGVGAFWMSRLVKVEV